MPSQSDVVTTCVCWTEMFGNNDGLSQAFGEY